ncbi:MAG: glycerol kinase GlpK [Aquabacterium sp.]|jgi:glycerol kinase|uniref:glycerol kinase GlpK n=1 Tax=Aquabacterium sp. TaxID=1872578 RepID=UPI001B5907DB|nr:glycerol kinase GlpK [Aquabacterium sp.]MBP7133078.1 glycerol kinase GlpK [Aquabacterium sp.]MBP9064232.1 glycerol kinase GlpK [Aquabacterium sp.]MDQ5926048.1 glycerol kinase [Pseudomonadota bacterium]
MALILALDQGTSSSRSIVFDEHGHILALAQLETRQHYPHPGWVEHDPMELWTSQRDTAHAALVQLRAQGRDLGEVCAVGITNQRETTVLWRRDTGQPVGPAIVWQDRRTEAQCTRWREQGLADTIHTKTGLVIDPYFSGSKLQWLLTHMDGARAAAERGELAFGTVDSWLLWNLTGGRVHATDVSNASRTMLFNIHTQDWDEELLRLMDIPREVLPQVHPSSHVYGEAQPGIWGNGDFLAGLGALPIGGIAGDQQAALFGQAGFSAGMAKNTYGTGCFMLMHTGAQSRSSANGLLSTVAAQLPDQRAYALEGSVFIGGAVVQWLRDGLHAIRTASEAQSLAESVPDSGGVMFVPAFTGLGAPYWDSDARGAILGLTRGSTVAHIARAALESIAFQSAALLQAMSRDAVASGCCALRELRVDGGACVNDLLMQFQADLLGIPVVRPKVVETTALGASYLAGLSTGVYADTAVIGRQWGAERTFEPHLSRDEADARMAHWERAVRQACTR